MRTKRLTIMVAGVLAAIPLLAACSDSPDENTDPRVGTVYVSQGKAMRCIGSTLMLWDRDPWDGGVLATTYVRDSVLCGGARQA